jgi:Flp pilus assembly pilin Flp
MKNLLQQFIQEEEGQSTVEYMLLISVVVIAIVAAAYVFLDPFKAGVENLAEDIEGGLNSGTIAGVGTDRGTN